jgi:hypothetical protein
VKSSLSLANGNCVEVADLPGGGVGVRNSRDPGGGFLRFTPDEWRAFLGGVRNSRDPGGGFLRFTPDEWQAFLGGVRNGEFDGFGRN